jgi:hypothetical protein
MGGIIMATITSMATINSNGTMVFGNTLGGSVTISPKNNTATNYTLTTPDTSGTVVLSTLAAFTTIPTSPTPTVGDNSNNIATTAFVNSAVSSSTSVSAGINGYQKLASGLIIQWGTIPSMNRLISRTVTFPITFPNACFSIALAGGQSLGSYDIDGGAALILGGYNVSNFSVLSATLTSGNYIAIGN